MTDILGPANAAFAVTARPAENRTFGNTDTWFVDCSSTSAADGTDIAAAWLNQIVASLRAVARANGNTAGGAPIVADSNIDNLLLLSLQHMAQRGRGGYGVDAGIVNAAEVALPLTPAEIFDGFRVRARMTQAPTGASTLRLNGVDALKAPIKRRGGAALVGREWAVNDIMEFVYNGPLAAWQIASLTASDLNTLASYAANQLFSVFQNGGTYTIPSPRIKITQVGGGGGGNGNYGGGAGAMSVTVLSGLTVGATLNVNIGAGGAGTLSTSANGSSGGATTITSGTQTIAALTAGGGAPGTTGGGGLGGTASGGLINAPGPGGGSQTGGLSGFIYPYGSGGSNASNGNVVNGVTTANNNGIQGLALIEAVA